MAIRRPTVRLLRKLMIAVGEDADQVTRLLTRGWTTAWDELSATWRAAIDDAVAYQARTGAWPQPWELARIERIGQAMDASEKALVQLSTRAGVSINDGVGQVVATDAEYEPHLVSSQVPAADAAAVATRFAANVVPSALDTIVARMQGQVVSDLRPLSAEAANAMKRELVRGVALGTNPNQVAAQMVARVQGAFNGGLARAINVGRTEMLDAYRAASKYQQAANGDIVAGWIWMSALDKRTCPSCWSMHGHEFPLDQPGPLDHQQGRCARAPKTKTWRELGYDIDEPADEIPDGQATFWKLPDADRKAIMGPGRLELLRSGRVGWDDLAGPKANPGWRPSYAPRTLTDLNRIADRGRVAAVVPTRPVGAPAAPPAQLTPAERRAAARARYAEIARHEPIARLSADIDHVVGTRAGLVWDADMDKIMAERISDATHAGLGDATIASVRAAVKARDTDQLVSAGKALAADNNLTPIGRFGQTVKFNDARHNPLSGFDPKPGDQVRIWRQGHVLTLTGEKIQLDRALVTRPAPTTANRWHRTLDEGQQRIAATLKGEVATETQLSGGVTGKTYLVTYKDGTKLVRKTYVGRAEGLRDMVALHDAEQLAPLVIRTTGSRAPSVLRTGKHEFYQEYVDGKIGEDIVPWGGRAPDYLIDSDEGRLLGLSDVLMGNIDRNPGNWIVTAEGHLVGIDHGWAFEKVQPWLMDGNEFARHFAADPHWAPSNDMSPADMAVIRRRLVALKPDFEHINRLPWWNAMMKRHEAIAKAATGTRSRLA